MIDNISKALIKEINQRKDYLDHESINTIYFGGGTPSLLSIDQLSKLLDTVYSDFKINDQPEITIEVNPDDLSKEYLKGLKTISINRLSIGIQSFFEEDLIYMHRAHTGKQAIECIHHSLGEGFDNISIDLMYGIPKSNLDKWKQNLEKLSLFNVQHLSCYALTVEPQTILAHQIAKKISPAPDDEDTIDQFTYLLNHCTEYGFHQYEISNFSKPGKESKHNSNYWNGVPYLGIGPSAHSFNGISRQWNISNNVKYVKALDHDQNYFEKEELTPDMKYNELIMTKLRTVKGIKKLEIPTGYVDHFIMQSDKLIGTKHLQLNDGNFSLTREGMYISDRILVQLFV